MRIWIDESARIPPYEQLRAQLRLMVSSGQLKPCERLPPIRALARELRLAPGTVARAYRELEWEGVVEGRGRAGTFVADEPPVAFSVVERQLADAAEAFDAEADRLGAGHVVGELGIAVQRQRHRQMVPGCWASPTTR